MNDVCAVCNGNGKDDNCWLPAACLADDLCIADLERQLADLRTNTLGIVNDFITPGCDCDQCVTLRQILNTLHQMFGTIITDAAIDKPSPEGGEK